MVDKLFLRPGVGTRFTRWMVTGEGRISKGTYYSKVVCDCGISREVSDSTLRRGTSVSCGCLQKELKALAKSTSNVGSPEYIIWAEIVQRCTNPRNLSYQWYGGRGITICDEWKLFENFFRDMGPRPHVNLQLDRENNELGYFPGNCRWTTRPINANNKRNTRRFLYAGVLYTLSELSAHTGIRLGLLHSRLQTNKMAVDKAVGMGNRFPYLRKPKEPT